MASVGGSTEKSGATPIGPIQRNIEEVALALVDRAREVELNRRIPDDIFEMVRATGVYRILQPAEFGGHQGNPVDAFDAIFELARSCPSTAWVTAVCVLHQWIMGCFSMAAQEDVWGENDQVLLCGSYAPQGQTARAEGGVRLSGVWEFVSGCDNTNWALLGVMVSLLAMTEGTSPGSKHPLYGLPLLSLTPYAISTVGLGAAQGGYDAYVDQVMVRKARGGVLEGGKSLAGIPAVQSRVGEAAGYIDAGRLIIKTDLEENLAIVTSGRKISVSRRIFCKRNEALATRMAVTAANAVYEGAGGAGLLAENRVQRAWRDANAVARHGGLNWDVQMSLYGSHILGLTPSIGY